MGWPTAPLGKFLVRSGTWVEIEPDKTYKQITARLWGRGLKLRGRVFGSGIAAAWQVQVREGQFLLSRIDARNGAFGLVPAELDGALVSGDFPAFDVDETQTDSRYLEWYSKTDGFVDLCRRASEGSTNRVRLKEERFLGMEMPLPSLDEQRRIVERLDRIAALIHEARKLTGEAERDDQLLAQRLHVALSGDDVYQLGNFLELWENREAVLPHVSYPQVGIKGFAGGLFRKSSIMGSDTAYRTFNRLHEGLLVVSQPKGWEGAIAVCDESVAGWFVSPEYRTFQCRKGRLIPRYLARLIRTPWFQARLARLTRGQGARRERLRPEMLLSMEIGMPNMDAQAFALEILDRCHAAQTQRSITAKMLDDVVPAMLHQLFDKEAGAVAKRRQATPVATGRSA